MDGLNPQQQQAITTSYGPVLVLAGPGSGKTRVLTHSIAYRIGYLAVRPYHILAVTFTNKAAREMESRVGELLGVHMRGLTLGTFHGVCVRILRREANYLPFDSNFVIFDSDDQLRLVKRALKDLDIDEKRYRPHSVHGAISRAKNELLLPDDFPIQTYRDEVVLRIYERYQQLLLASNAVDFDDLLLWTAHLLEEHPDVRQRYARRYEHVLVDEFQDTNMAQYNLLKHLASFHGNIFVVGDVDQSIYRWRGADYRNVLRFEQDYPGAQVILLEQNYRSTQVILDAAMAVIDRNPHRVPKKLFTERGAGQKIFLHEAYDDRAEATFVVDTIASLIARGQADPGDFAVMYRTNAQSRLLEEAFLRTNLPYKLVGAQRFYGRREIKDIIAYLRLVFNPADEASLLRVINVPPRRIGAKTLAALRTRAGQAAVTSGMLLLDLGRGQDSPHYNAFRNRAAASLAAFGVLLAEWQAIHDELSPLQLMDRILSGIGYEAYLDTTTDEGIGRWENVQELRRLAADYEERGLLAFLEDVALVSDQDTMDETASVPTLLTLHAAKGLEFPVVLIVGLEDGTLPHVRSFDDPESMAEERRLLYVGITRAKDRLFLVSALNRAAYGYAEPTESSRFLEDIPLELLDGSHLSR
ncbi:MAG: ATP-dependent helicase, partial [Anaerolineales bacterium]